MGTDGEPLVEGAHDADAAPGFRSLLTWPLAILFMITTGIASASAVFVWDRRPESPSAVDIGFADDMSAHHSQAIDMSITYLSNGGTPFLRHMAEEVLIYQIGEVRDLQAALAEWGEDGADENAMGWMGMPVDEYAQPGMATPAELGALERARGAELDDLFSRLMIRHHAGGGHMAAYTGEHARIGRIRDLATTMARGQASEIVELGNWRTDQGFDPVEVSDLPQ